MTYIFTNYYPVYRNQTFACKKFGLCADILTFNSECIVKHLHLPWLLRLRYVWFLALLFPVKVSLSSQPHVRWRNFSVFQCQSLIWITQPFMRLNKQYYFRQSFWRKPEIGWNTDAESASIFYTKAKIFSTAFKVWLFFAVLFKIVEPNTRFLVRNN